MEFNEKLQHLRKQKGWTQEETAETLFVSRTAISKWESGRGYPSIDSLKAISQLFSVSLDDLLSGEELISLAEIDQKDKMDNLRTTTFGIIDCMVALLFFLPLFGLQDNGMVEMLPLLSYIEGKGFIQNVYIVLIAFAVVWGVAQLTLQNWKNPLWRKSKAIISLCVSVLPIMLTILNRQPYPGIYLFCLFVLKGFLLLKQA